MILELKRAGMAVLLAEQNLALALSVADRCYVLHKGQVVFESTAEALRAVARSFRELLLENEGGAEASLADICFNAAARRMHHEHRLAVVGRSKGEMVESLRAAVAGQGDED